MQKQIYTQSLMKVKYILLAGLFGLLFVLAFLVQAPNPNETGTNVVAVFLICGIATALTTILIIWLTMKKTTIAVDLIGCDVKTSRPVGQSQTKRFEWKDVNSTSIFSKTHTVSLEGDTIKEHTFKVVVKGKSIDLITRGTVLRRDLVKLTAAVNAATPHLPYVWEECRTNETRRILDTISPYCKISRV